jgi:hypothetical protein
MGRMIVVNELEKYGRKDRRTIEILRFTWLNVGIPQGTRNKKVKVSRYTPWRCMGGEEVKLNPEFELKIEPETSGIRRLKMASVCCSETSVPT